MDTYSPSYSINKTHIYHVSKHSSSHYETLIDRGANGGLAGSDVRILERTGRTSSVIGDTIYIKTQVFRLLRYFSPALRNIARSDWATQNITHNMTSSKT